MSFLKSFRSSVSRKNNSNNNTSVVHIGASGGSFRNRSDYRGILKPQQQQPQQEKLLRSDTFTVQDEDSILVKAKNSAKSSMFAKLGTFTRSKKKSSPKRNEELTVGSYKSKQKSNGQPTSNTDPFGILYSNNQNSAPKVESVKKNYEKSPIDYSTYRKSKLPSHVREQLQEIKDDIENCDSPDKFKTVTINSFRKSFRQKFLNPKKDVPHNPAWFVEVDPPQTTDSNDERGRSRDKDLLVFSNENYRPSARSPVRENPPPIPKPRTMVKRNETFRVENECNEPSIRIEIKNSITPNEPGRMVPVGVAKPMPASSQSDRANIIQRTWMEPGRNSSQNLYQTTIQISDQDYNSPPRYSDSTFRRNYTPSNQTKIQINGNNQQRNSKDPYISNYSPLTSYGILSKLKQSSDPTQAYNSRSSQRHKSPKDHVDVGQSYDAKKCSQAPTISSRQKISTYFGDHGVRKETINTNRNNVFNNRRPQMKAPWR